MIKICADRREVGGGRREASGGSPEEEVEGVWVQGGTRADVSVDPEHICFQLACFC